jgi:hypothetical protein
MSNKKLEELSIPELCRELGSKLRPTAVIQERKELLLDCYRLNNGEKFLSLINEAWKTNNQSVIYELETFNSNYLAKQNSEHKIPGRSLSFSKETGYRWKETSSTYENAAYYRKQGNDLLENVKNTGIRDKLKAMPKKSEKDALNRYLAIIDALQKNRDRKSTNPTSKRVSVPLPLVEEIEERIKAYKKDQSR